MGNLEFSRRMKPAVSEENLGREESRSRKEKVAESDIGRKLELSGMRKFAESDMTRMVKPTISEDNLGREESRSIKEKVAESDMWRKLEISGMRKSAESDMRVSQIFYKTQNNDIKGERDEEGGELSCDSTRCMKAGRVSGSSPNNLMTQDRTSGHNRHDVTDSKVNYDEKQVGQYSC